LPAAATRLGWYMGNAIEGTVNRATSIDYVRVWSDDPPENSIAASLGSGCLEIPDVTQQQTEDQSDSTTCVSDSSSCPLLRLASDTIIEDATNRDSIAVNKTSDTGNILRLQKNSNDVLVVSNNGGLTIQALSGEGLVIRDGQRSVFSVNPAGKIVRVGGDLASAEPVLFVLSATDQTNDPAGINGAQYYSNASNTFRCFENGQWRNCLGASSTEFSLVAQKVTWQNIPTSTTEFGSSDEYRTWADLTGAREFRVTSYVSATSTETDCRVEFSADEGATWQNTTNETSYFGFSTIGNAKTDWMPLTDNAGREVMIRMS